MKFKVNGVEFEISDGHATYDVASGTMMFNSQPAKLVHIEHPVKKAEIADTQRGKQPSLKLPPPPEQPDELGKSSIKHKVLKMLKASPDGIVTVQRITISILGMSSRSADKIHVKRVLSDLVYEGVLIEGKRNDRVIYSLSHGGNHH
jgi:hypothetical protein